MSPRAECEAAMDDMAAHAEQLHQAAVLTLSTPALLAEVDAGLALRVCRRQTTARDVLLVQSLAARLKTASVAHARATNREPLDGMLMLDLGAPLETDESFALSLSELMQRTAPSEIAAIFRDTELET